MTLSDKKYDLLLHRVFQYVAVIGILAVLGGGYWYWKEAQASVTIDKVSGGTVTLQDTQSSQLTNGLIGYWPFNGPDISGTTAYDRAGSNNGALTNGPTVTSGRSGQALSFDGTDDYVNIGSQEIYNVDPGDVRTFSIWIKSGTQPTTRYFYWKEGGCIGWSFSLSPSGVVTMSLRTGDTACTGFNSYAVSSAGGTSYSDNSWHHIVGVIDRPNLAMSLYADGAHIGTAVIDNAYAANGGTMRIGTQWDNTASFIGSIDEPRVYDRALSAAEISDLYQLGNPNKINAPQNDQLTDGLVGLWSFNGPDISGTTAYDRSGQGNDGTLTNGPTTAIGKVGQALTFDGTNDHVSLPNVAALKPTGDFSVAFWYKGLKGSAENFIGHSPAVITNFWYINNTGATFCGASSCSTSTAKTYTLPSDNGWHHLAAILDRSASPDTLTVYIDGVSQGTATGTADGGIGAWGSTTLIGGPSWVNSGYRRGAMDEVRIYNRTLSAAEVQALYNAGW